MGYQTRFDFDLPKMKVRKCQFFVWQPEILTASPWCVAFDGYTNGKGDVTIHHCAIPKGRVCFPNLKLETPEKFANFVCSMLKVYQGFGGLLSVRTEDVIALQNGYSEGMKN